MKNRILFQQDLTLLSKSGMCQHRHYSVAYARCIEASKKLEDQIKNGAFSFFRDPFIPIGESTTFQGLKHNFQHCKMLLIIGSPSSVHTMRLLAGILQSWVWVHGSRPRLCFLDTVDPDIFWEVMSLADPQSTGIVVLSRSGKNQSTLLQFMRTLEYWKGLVSPELLARHSMIITGVAASPLRSIAQTFQLPCLDYPMDCPKGFACFSMAFLAPLMAIGMNCEDFLSGASWACLQFFKGKLRSPLQGSAVILTAMVQGIRAHTFMGNTSGFAGFNPWARQILSRSPLSVMDKEDLPCPGFYTMLFEQNMAKEQIEPTFWKKIPQVSNLATMPLVKLAVQNHDTFCQEKITQGNFLRVLSVKVLNEETLGALVMNQCLEAILVSLASANMDI